MDDPLITTRKAEHIRINLEEDVSSDLTTGLERYRFIHQALPEINLEDIQTGQMIFGRLVKQPLLISSMTGGTPQAAGINRILAQEAQAAGIAMGLGSMRTALENPDVLPTFDVRKYAPDILLLANLGAVQLNYGYDVEQCQRAVDLVGADALILHLNPLQEALQPEGDTRFAGLLEKIEQVCWRLTVPVVVKEVGWGISGEAAASLALAGVAAIDVAGAGGTSWSQVEMYRSAGHPLAKIASAFRGWGIPTAETIEMVRQTTPRMMIFASGGLSNGVDVAKSIALGACLGGMAGKFLKAANQSAESVHQLIEQTRQELRICMFASGAASIDALQGIRMQKD